MTEFLAKGKRGIVYLDKEKNCVVKKTNPKSQANNRLEIEAEFLKKLNRKGIGPKFFSFKNSELCMEYVSGERITEFFKNPETKNAEIQKIIRKVFEQLYELDKLGINKQELTNPYKHIIITKNRKPVMIDFERCRYSEKPKNITQFVQFLCSANIQRLFREKSLVFDCESLKNLTSEYKKNISKNNFEKILRFFS